MMISFLFCVILLYNVVECEFISAKVEDFNITSYCNIVNGNETFHDHTKFGYRINEPYLCTGTVYLLNYVQSASDHFDRRMLIRETFGSVKYIDNDSVKLFFVVGIPREKGVQKLIDNESANFRDIVQANFDDTYQNLTLKHIVALHWIHNYCPQAQFVTKSDDDTFVNNIWLRLYMKENVIVEDKFILGLISYGEKPIRSPGYKWTVDRQMYESDEYPPFIKGYGYIMSQRAIEPLFVCSYYHKYLFIDDIFITGIVRQSAGVILKYTDQIFSFNYFVNGTTNADVINNIFVMGINEISPHLWKEVWKSVLFLL